MAIKLFPFQQEAVMNALRNSFYLLCVRVGGGKTLIAMFYAKLLLSKKLADKVIFACTVSASVAVRGEFKEKLGIEVPQYENANDFMDFLESGKKVCVIKHSLFEKLGYDVDTIKDLKAIKKTGVRVALVIDEAHKLNNPKSIGHIGYCNIKFLFDRVLLMTATPYSSCLSQLYGVIHLIMPKLWKSSAEFFRRYIEEDIIMVNGAVKRKEKVAYKNLKDLRELISPFTFFYYPKIKLNFHNHVVRLKDYTEYDEICRGVLTPNEQARVDKGKSK
jgi:hypothetical protein